MNTNFFQRLSVRERVHARDKADVLVALLHNWASSYPCIRSMRIPSVALLTATVAPHIAPVDALASAQLSFWIFGVDDLADERALSLDELERRAERWYAIARGEPDPPGQEDELSQMLRQIRAALSRFRLFEQLGDHWAAEVRALVEAMLEEYRYALAYEHKGAQGLPSLDRYIASGLHSIGVPLWGWAVWLATDDPSILDGLVLLQQATAYASAAVRLYNDLRSYEKELGEGNVNSVLISHHQLLEQGHDQASSLAQAQQQILDLADVYGGQCAAVASQIQSDRGNVERVLLHTVDFHSFFYGRSRHDYNVTSLSGIYRLLDA